MNDQNKKDNKQQQESGIKKADKQKRAQKEQLPEMVKTMISQNKFLLQQIAHILQKLNHQTDLLQNNQSVIKKEFKRFQTGGPQRAMAAIFYRLFRDLLKIMNQLDELVSLKDSGEHTQEELDWIRSLEMLHGQLEFILTEWGCEIMDISPFQTPFDPDLHEAVPSEEEKPTRTPQGEKIPEGTIINVKQRGWILQGTILQYPRVVVS
jgi:molecular chaperone GrpE (heat shock protein)